MGLIGSLETNLSSWGLNSKVLPLLLVDAHGQPAPFRMQLLGELPAVADVRRSVELGHDLDATDSGVIDLEQWSML